MTGNRWKLLAWSPGPDVAAPEPVLVSTRALNWPFANTRPVPRCQLDGLHFVHRPYQSSTGDLRDQGQAIELRDLHTEVAGDF